MAPRAIVKNYDISVSGVLDENDELTNEAAKQSTASAPYAGRRKVKLVWRNIILFAYLHLAAIYGVWLMFTSAQWKTGLFAFALYQMAGLGITAGAHRLWAHRSYKAKAPLRFLLMLFNTLAFQDSAIDWARDHRVHHKYSETDADPHNATRGFFFSHVGWLLCRKHPDVKAAGSKLDLSDLRSDPILAFQHKYYLILMPIICFVLPTMIPIYCWGETGKNAWFVATMFRYCFVLNVTWLVNSAAHKFGSKPYDKEISPSQNPTVALLAFGEGWHNYHHVFPWDYKTAELGDYQLNPTTAFIDFFAKIGWAYDLKTVSHDVIAKRIERTGDGSHPSHPWGWDDASNEDKNMAQIVNKME